jgi:DNA-binding transcriptional LysR family regulator
MNDSRRRLLPSIGALASFSAAARHENFSRAGDELGLTQSAVSRQILGLEAWLQMQLFRRDGKKVSLTPEGREYALAIRPALDRIRAATDAAIRKGEERELNVATLPSFGMRWLAPRLPGMTAAYPTLVLNFEARSFPFDFAEEKFQAAIHYGLPNWAGARHDLLFQEVTIPVCSPSLLARKPIERPQDILAWPLLVQSTRRHAWEAWFRAAGLDCAIPQPSGSFEQFLMLAQAAAAGAGIALIPRFLIEPELASGALVSPLPLVQSGTEAYYLVTPEDQPDSKALDNFRDWILKEAAVERRGSPVRN